MTKNIIVMDIDSTLHDYMLVANKMVYDLHGIEVIPQPKDWDDFLMPIDGSRVWTEEEMRTCFDRTQDRDMIFASDPYPYAVEALNVLSDQDLEIFYFTDRKLHSKGDTEDWLNHHGFPKADQLIVCEDKRSNITAIKDSVLTIVDDRVRTLIWAKYELGVEHAFAIKQSYNWNLTDVPGIHLEDNWKALLGNMLIELHQ